MSEQGRMLNERSAYDAQPRSRAASGPFNRESWLLTVVSVFCLALGAWEYADWWAGNPGLVEHWLAGGYQAAEARWKEMTPDIPIGLCAPFTALVLIGLGLTSRLLPDWVRKYVLGPVPLLARRSVVRATYVLRAVAVVTIFLAARELLREVSFGGVDAMTPERFGGTTLRIVVSALLLRFLLCNLPGPPTSGSRSDKSRFTR